MKPQAMVWRDNWQRELEGTYLYEKLSQTARHPETKQAMLQMASQEREHAQMWSEKVRSEDPKVTQPGIDLRIRMVGWLGSWLGSEAVLNLLVNDEVSD